jgi:hypothetical protein
MAEYADMEMFIGKTAACCVTGRVSIIIHTAEKPAPEDWSAHVRLLGALNKVHGAATQNLVFTDGAKPDPRQTDELNAAMVDRNFATAVVMQSAGVRFIIAVLALWKWQIRAFSPSEPLAVLDHLKVDAKQRAEVIDSVRQLAEKFTRTEVVARFLAAAEAKLGARSA